MNGFERMYRRVVDYTQAGQWSEVYDGPIEGFDVEQLKAENAKLRELVQKFAEYVSQDRCLGCVVKSRCCDGEVDECWLLTEIRNEAHELGIEVCDG